MKNIKFYIFINLFALLSLINEIKNSQIQLQTLTHNNNNNCIYELKDGSVVDIGTLKKSYQDYSFVIGKYVYKANFCGTQVERCSGLAIPASINIRRNL